MIRRGIWVVLGAVLGITGYRRLTRLIRAIAPASAAVPLSGRQRAGGAYGQPRPRQVTARGMARGTATLARDVRAGLAEYRQGRDEYMNRHAGR
jgi:hypothetical protein